MKFISAIINEDKIGKVWDGDMIERKIILEEGKTL